MNLAVVDPKADVPANARSARSMLLSLVEGIVTLADSLDDRIQNCDSTEEDVKLITEWAFQIARTADTIRAWSPLLMTGELPDATHTIKYAMRKWSSRTWRSAYLLYQDVKRYDPRLTDGVIHDGINQLAKDGWLKQSNIGGGRTQYRRVGQ